MRGKYHGTMLKIAHSKTPMMELCSSVYLSNGGRFIRSQRQTDSGLIGQGGEKRTAEF